MESVNILINELKNAENDSVLVKADSRFKAISKKEYLKELIEKQKEIDLLKQKLDDHIKYSKHFTKYAKSHFLVVYNLFRTKVNEGEFDADDELMNLDQLVISGSVSVQEAIEKHPYLKETFEAVYLSQEDYIEFPEV